MKKTIILLLILGVVSFVHAQTIDTSDYLKIVPAATLNPGSFDDVNGYFDVELVGADEEAQYYTTVQMDIVLPEGINAYADENGDNWIDLNISDAIYPYTKSGKNYKYYHEVVYNIVDKKTLRISVYSSENRDFEERSGSLFYVYVNASSYAKPGELPIIIKNVKFIASDNKQYVPQNQPVQKISVANLSTLHLSVNSNLNWSTCVLPFGTETPSGVTAYTCVKKEADKVYLSPAESMEAYTPYVLYSENGFSGTLSGYVDASNYPESGVVNTDGLLNGAIVPQEISEGYVLQNLDGGVKFYKCDSQYTYNIPAGKCWLSPDAGSAKSLSFEIVDPTGIEEIASDSTDISIYTLDGKKVFNPQSKCVYIKSGKKFVNK